MHVDLEWNGATGYHVTTPSGAAVTLDSDAQDGPSPMHGCMAIDIVHILKRMRRASRPASAASAPTFRWDQTASTAHEARPPHRATSWSARVVWLPPAGALQRPERGPRVAAQRPEPGGRRSDEHDEQQQGRGPQVKQRIPGLDPGHPGRHRPRNEPAE